VTTFAFIMTMICILQFYTIYKIGRTLGLLGYETHGGKLYYKGVLVPEPKD
jgi:hypothetical protein